jgi:hypothetical protein
VSAEHQRNEPVACYEITEAATSQKKWTLSLYPDYFRLEAPDREPCDVERAERRLRVQTMDALLARRCLVVKVAGKNVIFRLTPEAFAAVKAWIGPPTLEDLKLSLKQRLGWLLPVGGLTVLVALPIGGLPLEPISLGLGLTLIVTALLAKLWPHRALFAVDSLWFSVLAANSIWRLLDEWSWLQVLLLWLQLALARSGWREYHRFAPERMAVEAEPAPDYGGA